MTPLATSSFVPGPRCRSRSVTFATFEGVTQWNPLAAHYTVDGQPLVQKWAVYRVETTLGHPLVNAMFFATSAAVMTMLAIEKPTRWRVTAAMLSTSGLVFTASRTGVIGLSLGIGVALVAMTFSRRTHDRTQDHRDQPSSWRPHRRLSVSDPQGARSVSRSSGIDARTVQRDTRLARGDPWRTGTSDPDQAPPSAESIGAGRSLVLENSLLQLGVSTGLPGVAVLFVLLGAVAGTAVRRADGSHSQG